MWRSPPGLSLAGHDVALCTAEGYRKPVDRPGVAVPPHEQPDASAGSDRHVADEAARRTHFSRIARKMTGAMRSSLLDQWEAGRASNQASSSTTRKSWAGCISPSGSGVPAVASLPLPFLTPTAEFPVPFIARWPLGRNSQPAELSVQPVHRDRLRRHDQQVPKKYPGLAPMSRGTDYLHRCRRLARPGAVCIQPSCGAGSHGTTRSTHMSPDTGSLIKVVAGRRPLTSRGFLPAGEPPIYIGFGSMGFGRARPRPGAAWCWTPSIGLESAPSLPSVGAASRCPPPPAGCT